MRVVIGTNQLDSSARFGHMNAVQALRRVQGTHRWAIQFEDILDADTLLLVGTNVTETNPDHWTQGQRGGETPWGSINHCRSSGACGWNH